MFTEPIRHEDSPSLVGVMLSFVPGLGHWWIGYRPRGLVVFAIATASANIAFLAWLVGDRSGLALSAGCIGLAIAWLFSVADVTRHALVDRLPAARARRSARIDRGEAAYRAHDWDAARAAFTEALARDGTDPLIRLWLACVERRAGHPARALDHAGRALAARRGSLWDAHLRDEERLAREALKSART